MVNDNEKYRNTLSLNKRWMSVFCLSSGVLSHAATISGSSTALLDTATAAEIGPFQLFARSTSRESLSIEATVNNEMSLFSLDK